MSTYVTKGLSGQSGKRAAKERTARRSSASSSRPDIKMRGKKTGQKVKVFRKDKDLPAPHAYVNHLVDSWERSSPVQWVEIVRNGVPVRTVGKFAKNVGLQKDVMFSIIHLSRSTAHRLEQKNEVMDTLRSDAFAGAYTVIQKARKMLSSEEALRQWLNTPIPALDSKAPIEWLDTNLGRQIVSSLLDQVQSGAYA
jgi:putative toxin-antitoxin system antitoxin component (TIGR02293 family)